MKPLRPGEFSTRVAAHRDITSITALVAACEFAHDGVAEVHSTDVEHALQLAGDGGVIVAAAAEQLVGWATLAGDRATIDVHPAWCGRGVGTSLRMWTERRARAAGAVRVRQVVTDANRRAQLVLDAAGYRPTHTSWILQMEMGDQPPEVAIPEGISIRPYQHRDAATAYRLIEDAFNEWPDRQPTDFEGWRAHIIGHGSFAPHLSRLAFEADEPVGVVLTDAYEGEGEGWVQQIATKATHRHRGIARALLQSAAGAFHASGRRRMGLSTNSQSGALGLYERVGMRVRRTYTGWAKDTTAPTSRGAG